VRWKIIIIILTTTIIIIISIIIILRNAYSTLVGKRERMRSRGRLALDVRGIQYLKDFQFC
jgi:ABC-type transport system involved in cytochrome bd biosynthesis fused ATPase/permease subunit